MVAAAQAGDFSGLVDIGNGRDMYLECRGSGSPLVVFVSGNRASAQDWSIVADGVDAASVFEQVSARTRACAYDRPGTPVGMEFSRSDPVPMPTTSADMVADLHALLAASGATEPVVVVGHSAGGLAARLYAATHPGAVAGLVLIDALSPELQDAETPAQWEIQRRLLVGDITGALQEYPDLERIDADASMAQMRDAPPMQPMPLVVISADKPWAPIVPQLIASGDLPADIPPDFGTVVDTAQHRAQGAVAALLPGSEHLTKTDSGHNVHQEQPQLVTDAILGVVDRLREGG